MVVSVICESYTGLAISVAHIGLGTLGTYNTVAQRLFEQSSVVADCTTVFSVRFGVLLDTTI